MKRRELPDGTIEIEGEPDELAEYDNLKTETPKKKKKGKRKLLTEEQVLDMVDEAIKKHELLNWHQVPFYVGNGCSKLDLIGKTTTSDTVELDPFKITCKA